MSIHFNITFDNTQIAISNLKSKGFLSINLSHPNAHFDADDESHRQDKT